MINMLIVKYILNNFPFFFFNFNIFFKTDVLLFIKNFVLSYLVLFFKYSIFFINMCILDLICFEVPILITKSKPSFNYVIVYLYLFNNSRLFLFSLINGLCTDSIELLFRNAVWQEREVSDFFNIFFKYKKDRRNLFVLPIIQQHAFEKKSPVGGFYELFVCLFFKKIKFRRISYIN